MNKRPQKAGLVPRQWYAVFALCSMVVWAGCSKGAGPAPAPVSIEESTPTLESAFQQADPQVQAQANDAAVAMQGQDDAAAFVNLQSLSERPELTPEQRQAAFQAWYAVQQRLQAQATNGNQAAQELLNRYRATK